VSEESHEPVSNPLMRGLIGGAIGAGSLLLVALIARWTWPNELRSNHMSYPELAAIILTGVGVLVALLGAIVAVFAVWGFGEFKRIAKRTAKGHVKQDIKNGKLREFIESSVTEFLEREFSDEGRMRTILEERVWGTQMIERTALGDPDAITSPVRATAARINIHLHRQLFYDDPGAGLYDTDEEWTD
jgi:hypothetical protein